MSYYTNGECWQFKYKKAGEQREILRVHFSASKLPKKLPDIRRHTTVEIKNARLDIIAFNNFLFLRPPAVAALIAPSEPLVRSETGYICCGPAHAGRLHVRGMLVKEYHTADLQLGYNLLADVQLDRDRGVIEDPYVLGKNIYAVWSALLLDQDQVVVNRALDAYVPLHLCDPEPIDVRESGSFIDRQIAELLMRGVLERIRARRARGSPTSSRHFWLSSVGIKEENLITSMDYDIELIPVRLYTILRDLEVLWDAEEQQRRVFSRSPESKKLARSELYSPSAFACHTEHLITVFRTIVDPTLRHVWKDAGDTNDLDVYAAEDVIFFHDRNLDVQVAHPDGSASSCPVYGSLAFTSEGSLNTTGVRCDCSAHLLAEKLHHATASGRAPSFRDYAALLPRSFEVSVDPTSSGAVTISWSTLCEPRDAHDFVIEITPGTVADSPHRILHTPVIDLTVGMPNQGTAHR